MAVHDFSKPDPDLANHIGAPDRCFLCGSATHRDIAVFWLGLSDYPTLFLHERCAKELGCHLISDAIDAKKMRAKRWRPVVIKREGAA